MAWIYFHSQEPGDEKRMVAVIATFLLCLPLVAFIVIAVLMEDVDDD